MRLLTRNVEQRVAPIAWVFGFALLLALVYIYRPTSPRYAYVVTYVDAVSGNTINLQYHFSVSAYSYHDGQDKTIHNFAQLTPSKLGQFIQELLPGREIMPGTSLTVEERELKSGNITLVATVGAEEWR